MINSTQGLFFILEAYFDTGLLKYLYFIIVMFLYMLILCSNLLLIVVICVNRNLHEPMYMFLCSLLVNELYGSTGLFPLLLGQILSDIHTVSASACFLQIYCVNSYGGVEYLNLAVMSYDRYLAICYPLQYNTRMTSTKIIMLIAVSWLHPFFACAVMIFMTSSLQLCGNIINKVYCDTHSVVKLACFDTKVNNIYGLTATFGAIFGALILIIYTYVNIFKVCFSGSKQTRQKAVSTCTPHLTSLLNFSVGASFEILQSRFNMSGVPNMCGNIINKVYCVNYSVVKLACFDTNVINIYGLITSFGTIFGALILICYTYIKILKVCLLGSKQTRQKAVSTCTPHLASLLNLSVAACFEIVQNRFDMSGVPNMLRIFLSLYFFTCPPLFNPLMYGLNLSKIRVKCKNLIANVLRQA